MLPKGRCWSMMAWRAVPALVAAGIAGCNSPRGVTEPAQMRAEILSKAPIGSSIVDAEFVMAREGFNCKRITNGQWGDTTGVDYLYCRRGDQAGWPVYRRWMVALIEREGKVADVQVTTGLVGP